MSNLDIAALARPAIVAMRGYVSARSIVGAATAKTYLDANELGGDLDGKLNRYPEPQPHDVSRLLCDRLDLGDGGERLFIGAGVDDAIDALLRVFCEAGDDAIVITPPTYGYYAVAAAIQGAVVREAPLGPATAERPFDLNEAEILRLVHDDRHGRVKLVFVCSPNNPTGGGFDPGRLLELAAAIRGQALLVVDEAYIEFSARASLVPAAGRTAPNLVVLRTLSKAWGLAGVRLGVAVAAPEVVRLMHKVRAPYPIARPAAAAAVTALSELTPARLGERVLALGAERQRLVTALGALPLVTRVYPSEANFLLVEVRSVADFLERCTAAGVVVRDRSFEPGLARCIRISVGTAAENVALLAALGAGGRP